MTDIPAAMTQPGTTKERKTMKYPKTEIKSEIQARPMAGEAPIRSHQELEGMGYTLKTVRLPAGEARLAILGQHPLGVFVWAEWGDGENHQGDPTGLSVDWNGRVRGWCDSSRYSCARSWELWWEGSDLPRADEAERLAAALPDGGEVRLAFYA